MAHEVETMAYSSNEVPWHGLGVPVSNDLTPAQMLEAASLDWEVAKFDNYVRIGNVGQAGNTQVKTGTQALVRLSDNKVLSPSVGPDWEPVQNQEAFEFFHEFVDAGSMTMETAGSLKGGQLVWALAKVNESFELFDGDRVESYLLFSNSHQYGKSTIVDFTPIRVVCNNTLTLALNQKSKQSVTINHRAKFDPARVKTLLGVASSQLSSYKEAAEFLGSVKASTEEMTEYFAELFPVHGENSKKELSKNAKVALEVLPAQPGAEFAEGTWWQAFNTVTYMADHVLCRQDDTRLYNTWFGSTKDTKVKALNKALELARA